MKIKLLSCSLVLASAAVLSGCSVPKNVAYFQDTETSAILAAANPQPITIKPDDKINIIVKTKDPAISDLFNLPVYSTRIGQQTGQSINGTGARIRSYSASGSEGIAYYTVDPEGNIDFPVLGKIHVEGMTRPELAGYIKGELAGRDLAKDPTVVVEFPATGVNILGEVMQPGRYDLNRDRINVIEAISLAGDMTISGQRQNVKVIREEEGKVKSYVVDLTNMEKSLASPGYYLQQNDIVYVEPNEKRKRETTVNGNNALSTSFWISVGSLLMSAVTTIGVFVK